MRRGSITLYDASPLIWLILALTALAAIFLLGGYKESVSSWTIAQSGEGPTITISRAELERMSKTQAERAWVYYPDAAMQPVAEQIAEALSRAYALIPERLGLEPKPMGLVLIGGEEPGMVKVEYSSDVSFPLWLPAEVIAGGLEQATEETLGEIYWTMPHEVTEGAISPRLYHDCATRWVGDGLADYAGYVVSGQFSPAAQQRRLEGRLRSIEKLLKQGKQNYNLAEEFQALRQGQVLFGVFGIRWGCRQSPFEIMVAGYAVSLSIWLNFVDKHGEEIIKQFWQELQQIPRPTNQNVIKILSKLTGEDVGTMITNVDLNRAAEVLRGHVARKLGS